MKRTLLLLALLLLPIACGPGTDADSPGGEGGGPATGRLLRLQDWEWLRSSAVHVPEVSGRVLSAEGEPLAEATVTLLAMPPIPVAPPRRVRKTRPDAGGRFVLRDVPENGWVLAEVPGRAGVMARVGDLAAANGAFAFRLEPGGTVVGSLRLESGDALAGRRLLASAREPNWWAVATTDANGRFEIRDAPFGEIGVMLLPGEFRSSPVPVTVTPDRPAAVEVVAQPVPPVLGRVLDEETGKAIPHAVISALVDEEKVIVADEEGRFRIDGSCQAMIVVRADGYGETPQFVDPLREERTTIVVKMPRGGAAAGRVVDASGRPLAGVRVSALIDPEDALIESRGPLTREDGTFLMTWIPLRMEGDRVAFIADGPGFLTGLSDIVELRRGERAEGIEITLSRPARLSLRVVDDDGKPRVGARVLIRQVAEGLPRPLLAYAPSEAVAETDAEGRAVLRGLRGGPHELSVVMPSLARSTKTVDVSPGRATDLGDYLVRRKLAIGGKLLSSIGEPLVNARVLVVGRDTELRHEVKAAPDGSFLLEGLDPGKYSLRVNARLHDEVVLTAEAGTEDLEIELKAFGQLFVKVGFPPDYRGESRVEVAAAKGWPTVQEPLWRELPVGKERALFEKLSAGRHRVRVTSGDYVGVAEVTVSPGPEPALVTVPLSPGATVAGTVTLPDGKPAARVGVECGAEDGWGFRGTRTDDEGRFEFRAVHPGEVRLRCHPKGHPAATLRVRARAGERSESKLGLAQGGKLRVTVLDPGGRPVAGARVSVADEAGAPVRFWIEGGRDARTARDGQVLLTGLPGGRFTVTAVVDDRAFSAGVEVSDGEISGADITIER